MLERFCCLRAAWPVRAAVSAALAAVAALSGGAAAIALGALMPATAHAAWPDRPVRLIVAFPPGGPVDQHARLLSERLAPLLGQPVLVDYKPGAGGNIGADAVAKSAPDGLTLLVANTGQMAINPALYSKLPYDPSRDLVPVARTALLPLVMVVNRELPVRDLREFIAHAKARPGQLNYASGGNGGISHLAPEMFEQAAGIFMVHLPYKGSAPALTDVIAGHAQMMTDSIPLFTQQIRAGQVRALAVTGRARSPALPQVPTMIEQGLKGFEVVGFYGVLAPAGTPREAIAKLSDAIGKVLAAPDVRERLAQGGAEAAYLAPEAFAGAIRGERERWARAVKASGATID